MNSVYQQLRSNFEADTNYQGADVLAAILGVIKVLYNSTILSQYIKIIFVNDMQFYETN